MIRPLASRCQRMATAPNRDVRLGLGANLAQFSLLVVVNAFVGAMVGLERSILPAIAVDDFQLAARAWAVAGITFASGTVVAVRMRETLRCRERTTSIRDQGASA